MKSPPGAILIAGQDAWRIGATGAAATTWTQTGLTSLSTAAEIHEKLPAALQRAGCRGRPLLLALSSGDCLAASIPTSALPRKLRRRAMEYRLEGKIPLAIEEVATDFVTHNGQALGVAVRNDTILAAIDAIGACGIQIAAVCPAALLGFQSALPSLAPQRIDAMIWTTGDFADVFLLEGGELIQWHWVPATPADVGLILASASAARRRSLQVGLRGASPDFWAQIGRLPNVQIIADDPAPLADAAAQAAARILAHDLAPLVNFHPVAAAAPLRRPFLAALLACCLLCLSLIGATVWRAQRYAALADQFADQEARLYQQLYPGQTVPLGIESRLRSDAADRAPAAPDQSSCMTLLYDLLAHLPPGAKFQFDELDLDSGHAALHGRADSLADADAIAAALRKAPNLQVDDPQTQQLAGGGVGFTLAARQRKTP
jgi:hypothetical protein